MTPISYDARRSALYTPEQRETLFVAGQVYSELQLAIEGARLAYCRAETDGAQRQRLIAALERVDFGKPELFSDAATGTQAFGAYRHADGTALVAFRGTQPEALTDLIIDLQANPVAWNQPGEPGGRVHAGFARAARAVLPAVRQWLDAGWAHRNELILTGHSLGAALATLAASVLQPTLWVAIGSPRVGDAAFAASLAAKRGVRIVDCCDAITDVPLPVFGYSHVGPASYLTRDGERVQNPDSAFIRADRLQGIAQYVAAHALEIDAVRLRELADHAPINYARAYF